MATEEENNTGAEALDDDNNEGLYGELIEV